MLTRIDRRRGMIDRTTVVVLLGLLGLGYGLREFLLCLAVLLFCRISLVGSLWSPVLSFGSVSLVDEFEHWGSAAFQISMR